MGIPHYFRRIVLSFALISTFLWLYNAGGVSLQPKYNSFSCPGYVTPAIKSSGLTNRNNNNTTVVNPSPPSDQPILPDFSSSPFAYVFYATQSDYACSVLVNIDRLQNLFNTTHRIIVLVRPDLASSYLTAFTRLNATVIPYSPPELRDEQIGYYHDVLLKLVAFRLHHYIPSLKRILVLDSDQLILQSLDHVFDLPPVDVAAPRAYWSQEGTGFTSTFLLVTLSDRVWDRMTQELGAIKQNVFDMDLVNEMFKQTVLMLPGDYATLNSHWETNDIPSWWMGDRPVWPYTQLQPPKEKVAPKKNMPPGEVVPEQESLENDVWEELDGDGLYNGQPVVQQRPQPTQQQQAPQLDQASPQPQASKQEQALPQQQAPKQEQAPPQQAPPQQAPPQQAPPQQAPPQQASSQQQASQKAESPQQPQPDIKQPTQPSQDNPKHQPEETSAHPSQQQTQQPPQHQQPPSNSLSQPSQAPTQPTSETNPESKVQRRSSITEEEAQKRAYEEDQLKKRREIYDAVLYEIYAAVKVLHFTALGKPWSWHIGDVEEARPFAHDLFKVQFETWQNASWRLCNPEWR